MAIFNKTDPAVKRQRDLEAKLKDKLASRDGLIDRRKAAEASAAAHREKARKLAGDGADDAALSAAESAMRREQDRIATFGDALGDVETTVGNLEREIAEVIDQRCRRETAAAVTALADKWATAGATFGAAVGELADLARESALIVLDAHGLQVFLDAVKQQVPPAADVITNVLRDHAKAVLVGTAPASLPKPEEPARLKAIEPSPSTQTVFCLRSIKWTDSRGEKHVAQQYDDASLELHIAARAIKRGVCAPVNDPRRKTLLHAHGGKHPRADAIDTIDLDEQATRPPLDPIVASDPVPREANFREVDRSAEARVLKIAVPRL